MKKSAKCFLNAISKEFGDSVLIDRSNSEPFPQYELEIAWSEWRWNNEGTSRIHDTYAEGVTVNPVDHTDENGNLNWNSLEKAVRDSLSVAVNNENRVGAVRVIA